MQEFLMELLVYLIAGLGAGIGTGLSGLSAASVISPMLITFLGFDSYMAVGIALASDVLASGVSAYTYGKNDRVIPEKISQSIQIDRESAKFLVKLLLSEFDLLA